MISKKARVRQLIIVIALIAYPLRITFDTLAQDAPATPVAEEPTPVVDVTPPNLWVPANLAVGAADASGASVSFDEPNAFDDVDGGVAVSCDWVSGSLFPLGVTTVNCSAQDSSGNVAYAAFTVSVADWGLPEISAPTEIVIDAAGEEGSVVAYGDITAYDAIDGALTVTCDPPSESLLPIGTTTVTCVATDLAGNQAVVTFPVTVKPLGDPDPTETEETGEPTVEGTGTPGSDVTPDDPNSTPEASTTPDPNATVTPVVTEGPAIPTATPTPVATTGPARVTPVDTTVPNAIGAGVEATAEPSATPTPSVTPSATPQVPDALTLQGPRPDSFTIVYDGGPIGSLSAIWGGIDFPISQEFGHTEFSIAHYSWYAYGSGYGLDGFQHTGLDIGMPAGTPLYSPVAGTVMIAGGVPFYTFYGNGQPGVGELMIQTSDGQQVILGHMGMIDVNPGQWVERGDFVGLSGGDNGDHLHLEVRELQMGGWYRIVDPRQSFLVAALEGEIEKPREWGIPLLGDLRYRLPDFSNSTRTR